jgi:hypothetical protein
MEPYLYEFGQEYRISYINFLRAGELTDARLLLALERGCERHSFVFSLPLFNDIEKSLVACRSLYIAAIKHSPLSPSQVEVGDAEGKFVYFTAHAVRDITPTA